MFLTIFASRRSSKISLQTSPEVRHQFRRKLRQLHSGNHSLFGIFSCRDSLGWSTNRTGENRTGDPLTVHSWALPWTPSWDLSGALVGGRVGPLVDPLVGQISLSPALRVADYDSLEVSGLPCCRAFVVMDFHSESVDFLMDFLCGFLGAFRPFKRRTAIPQRNPQQNPR